MNSNDIFGGKTREKMIATVSAILQCSKHMSKLEWVCRAVTKMAVLQYP